MLAGGGGRGVGEGGEVRWLLSYAICMSDRGPCINLTGGGGGEGGSVNTFSFSFTSVSSGSAGATLL
jgi:hypothetical protein